MNIDKGNNNNHGVREGGMGLLYRAHSGQPMGWSGWVQDQAPYCGQL